MVPPPPGHLSEGRQRAALQRVTSAWTPCWVTAFGPISARCRSVVAVTADLDGVPPAFRLELLPAQPVGPKACG